MMYGVFCVVLVFFVDVGGLFVLEFVYWIVWCVGGVCGESKVWVN